MADVLGAPVVKFAEAWLRGQPGKAAIATTLFKDKIQQMKS
ncbi:hypothetical protein [Actinoplanes sp. TBRC 11911]|nr:hypothetical protein [Actinoplanes sp. TBRC 11911]